MGAASGHGLHGDPARFEVVAARIAEAYGRDVRYIADVAGGRGVLSRILSKKYNYGAEVVDPRGWVLKGVRNRAAELDPALAEYYDLIVGLHPDQATRAVARAALVRPAVLIPCCNSWSGERLGRRELLGAIEGYYRERAVSVERVALPFGGPHDIALISKPSRRGPR